MIDYHNQISAEQEKVSSVFLSSFCVPGTKIFLAVVNMS